MRHFSICLVAGLLAIAFAGRTAAQGAIAFTTGYPKPGCSSGQIDVQGSFTPNCGWMSAGSTVIVSVWQDGEEVTNFEFDIQPGNVGGSWIGTCTGLSPCAAYNVTAEVVLIDGSCNTATIRTVIERTTTN